MFCSHCGTSVPNGSRFCLHCGTPQPAPVQPPIDAPQPAPVQPSVSVPQVMPVQSPYLPPAGVQPPFSAQPPRRKRRLVWLAVVLPAIVLALAAVFVLAVLPQLKHASAYASARQLLKDGSFSEAADAFAQLGDYKDAADMLTETRYQQGLWLLEEGNFDKAVAVFETLSGYRDAAAQVQEAKYRKGISFIDSGKYNEAAALFQSLGDYRDSADQISEALYRKSYPFWMPALSTKRSHFSLIFPATRTPPIRSIPSITKEAKRC